jgi:hypothetical protein
MRVFRFAAFGLPLLVLAGCNTAAVNNCPVAVVLADASRMAVFKPGAAQDLSGEDFRVFMTGASTDCSINRKNGRTDSSLTLQFRATRAPTTARARYTVPYFVAVTQGDRLIAKRIVNVSFEFAPGAATASFSDSPDDFDIQMESGHKPYEYELMAGFQMTPAQVEYNKKMGRYLP